MIQTYIDMLADAPRLEAMERAIARAVKPGDVVLDVGTGTGAFALFAARAGAKKVYALERGPVVELARQMVAANDATDVVQVVHVDAARWDPPEPIDVVVFEDFDDTGIGPTMSRLAQRFRTHLRTGGRFVPESISVRVAAVEHDAEHRRGFPWSESAYGLDVSPMRALAEHIRSNCHVDADHLLTAPQTLVHYRLGDPLPAIADHRARLKVVRPGALHGLALWFDAELGSDERISNAPGPEPTIWQCAFLHTRGGARIEPTDTISLALSHAPWGEGQWQWRWDVRVLDTADAARHHEFHSTFEAEILSVAQIRRMSLDAPIVVDSRIQAIRHTLDLIDGNRSPREIGRFLHQRFPERFEDEEDAARQVLRELGVKFHL